MSEEAPTPISFEDFEKVDIRAGTVTAAEMVPKSDRLLKLQVDLGPELGTRTCVAGIAQWYNPVQVLGRTFIFVVNLAPRKLKGIESTAMIMAGPSPIGLQLASCNCPPGTRIG